MCTNTEWSNTFNTLNRHVLGGHDGRYSFFEEAEGNGDFQIFWVSAPKSGRADKYTDRRKQIEVTTRKATTQQTKGPLVLGTEDEASAVQTGADETGAYVPGAPSVPK